MRSRWTRWAGFEPSEQVLTLLTKVTRSELIVSLTQARVELLLNNSQCAVSAAWLFEFAASDRFKRKMHQLKHLTAEDITIVQGPCKSNYSRATVCGWSTYTTYDCLCDACDSARD